MLNSCFNDLPPNDFKFVKQEVNVCCLTDTEAVEEATLSVSEYCKSETGTMSNVVSTI